MSVGRLQRFYSSTTPKTLHFDICIIGAGMVGASLACKLAQNPIAAGHSIAMIEGGDALKRTSLDKHHYSNRVSSITPKSQRFLQDMGAWQHIPKDRLYPYDTMNVWDAVGQGSIQFSAQESHQEHIAWIVENYSIQESIMEALTNAHNPVALFNKSAVKTLTVPVDRQWPTIELENGTCIQARVGADGGNSMVRKAAGIESIGWDYHQCGVVATVAVTDLPSTTTAWQRFLPTGPVALLPLSDKYYSLVWTVPTDVASKLVALSSTDFVEILNTALHNPYLDTDFLASHIDSNGKTSVDFASEREWGQHRSPDQNAFVPPRIVQVVDKSRAMFPLRLRHSQVYAKGRTVLIGDAAHTMHPLAGQGLNAGLSDAEQLSDVLLQAIKEGQDVGANYVIEKYTADRYAKNLLMLGAVDTMSKLFNNKNPILSMSRSLGLNLVNQWSPIKLMQLASS